MLSIKSFPNNSRSICKWLFIVDGEGDEEFEVLDVSSRGWVGDVFKDVSKGSVAKQITVGGVSGWYVSKHTTHTQCKQLQITKFISMWLLMINVW